MGNIEHWFCPGCGEIDGPRAGMTCHGPGYTGGCASVGNEVVEISHDAAKRLRGAVEALAEAVRAHTRAIHALAGNLDYPKDERSATGERLAALLAAARGQ